MDKKEKNNFVPETFQWVEPDEQKRRARELNNITKKKQKNISK